MNYRIPIALLVALLLLVAVVCVIFDRGRFSYEIDPSLSISHDELPSLEGGGMRAIGTMVGPNGERDDFALNEVIMPVSQERQVDTVVSKYGGEILESGDAQRIEGITPAGYEPSSNGLLLIRVDLARSSLEDLVENMSAAGISGRFVFSSEEAARLMAILARERKYEISPNPVLRGDSSYEHPTAAGGNLDAERWWWMTEDDDLSTPDIEDGLSIGVTHAWDYLYYEDVLGQPGVSLPTYVAVVDSGFALDSAGVPRDGNKDYFYYGSKPFQVDMVDHDGIAGGENRTYCAGFTRCPWHGQHSFGVLGAVPRNKYGSAGTGGPVVVPILVRVDWTWYGAVRGMYALADSIRASVLYGAGAQRAYVVSISSGGSCYTLCELTELADREDFPDYMQQAVLTAVAFGAVVVAAAGNEGWNLDQAVAAAGWSDVIPCELNAVICVGAVNNGGVAESYSNYGRNVDIWAPDGILTTSDPQVAAADSNNVCSNSPPSNESCDELSKFYGTSAATPFIAGVIALMAHLDSNSPSQGQLPALGTPRVEAVRSILRSSANDSTDAKVVPGYVDALRALLGVRANSPPVINVIRPSQGSVVGWKIRLSFGVEYADPEVDPDEIYRWAGTVRYTSDLDGELCVSGVPPYSCTSTLGELTVGDHRITVTATDPFGGSASKVIMVEIVNRPPTVKITSPDPSSTLYSDIPVVLSAYVTDPDEPIDDSQVNWSSDLLGPLGPGRRIDRLLSTGTHQLTATVSDGKGLTASDQVTVVVKSGIGVPNPRILYPGTGGPCCFSPGVSFVLRGEARDEEDGELTGSSLEWHSDIDRFLGVGKTLAVTLSGPDTPCFPEYRRHQVSLVAEDSDGNRVSVTRQISIGAVC